MATQRQQHMRQPKDNQNQGDIIGDIPDSLLVHILSFLSLKEAVQTCILSKRWINLWKTLSTLIFTYHSNFKDSSSLEKFIDHFMSLRDHSTPIRALCISFQGVDCMDSGLTHRVMEYASSHGVQHLRFKIGILNDMPACLFSSHTLTYLKLSGHYNNISFANCHSLIFPNSVNLPVLTTLSLKFFCFSRRSDNDSCVVDPFSAITRLNTLIIKHCLVLDNAQNLRISCTNLVNLTISMCNPRILHKTMAPEGAAFFGIELYTPTLHTLAYTSNQHIHKISGSKSVLSSIKHVIIDDVIIDDCYYPLHENPSTLFNWLDGLANVESLTVSPAILMAMSDFPDLFKFKPPSLYNLKSLKIKTFQAKFISIVEFLLQNSPLAKVEIGWFKAYPVKGKLFEDLPLWVAEKTRRIH